ncbi:MAG: HD domain-containing protein [Archaeoglobaceae archaeon]|nr:HD domain-containing protein [Archaeoglobaceae archaeon]MCX8152251.1 HD domain-containing protein [Archaeoglobaceae archaeon]MDW8013929.1 HD domain-containing protein [Archaeoglobaceae archaeon]
MERVVRFIHEVGTLKTVPRSGWLKIGLKLPESVAEHSFRTAVIAMLLAIEDGEKEKAFKACAAALLHDLHEARTMDLHEVAKSYVEVDKERVLKDQRLFDFDFSDVEKYVRDADKLELAFQAVEYSKMNDLALDFAEDLKFETKIAEEIYKKLIEKRDPRWWI